MPTPPPAAVPDPSPRVKRSLFGNYAAADPPPVFAPASPPDAPSPPRRDPPEVPLARSFLYQFLARAFEYPSAPTWSWMSEPATHRALVASSTLLEAGSPTGLGEAIRLMIHRLHEGDFDSFHDDYVAAVGHGARGSSPINEIEYGDLRADPLLQPHRLADLAAFYRAFGMELTADGGERQDHLAVELEFMAVLTGKESHTLASQEPDPVLEILVEAERLFLREHLARWSPTFVRRLQGMIVDPVLRAASGLLLEWVSAECRRTGCEPATPEVQLRPADEEASLCDRCGLPQALPGAAPTLTET